MSKLHGHTQHVHNTHLLGDLELGHAPPWNFLNYRIWDHFWCCFQPQIPFIQSYLCAHFTSTWNLRSHNHANTWSLTLAFYIIFTWAPMNLTWAQAQVCPGVATPLLVALLLEGSYTHIYNNLGPSRNIFLADISKSLYEKPYFEKLKVALRPGGIICSQGETKRDDGCGQ